MKPTTYFMEKYRYLCLYANLSPNVLFIFFFFFSSNTENLEDRIEFYLLIYVFIEKENLFWHKIHILNCLRTF